MKTLTLTDDEVIDILVSLEDKIQSFKETRKGYVDNPEDADFLKWLDDHIQQMTALYQKIITMPSSD